MDRNAGLCAIAVMAKAPQPGRVKTRLTPPLSPADAMALSRSFLRDTTTNIRLAGEQAAISGYVAYAPANTEKLFDGMLAEGTRLILADGAPTMPAGVQGFGRSLLHAARGLFDRGYGSVCLLNSDSPTLPTGLLVQAAQALLAPGDRVVLGPAEDGGYYLVGMKAPHAGLFEYVAWSTEQVAEQTSERARVLGLEIVELAAWYDVDDLAALHRLLREIDASAPGAGGLAPYAAPATVACVDRLGLRGLLAASIPK